MKKKILGIGLSLCLVASGLAAFTGCGKKDSKFNFTVDFDPACVYVGVEANKEYSSDVIRADGDHKSLRLHGYSDVYNYDNMVVTINGEPAGDRFERISNTGDFFGTLRIDGLTDKSSIKISNIEDKFIKVGFLLDASELINNENRRKFDESTSDQLEYTEKAIEFTSNLRLKMSDIDLTYWRGKGDTINGKKNTIDDNTNNKGTLFTEFFQDSDNVIFRGKDETGKTVKYKAPYMFTLKLSDLYKARVETRYVTSNSEGNIKPADESTILRQYDVCFYEYAGIPVYNEIAAGYFTSPVLRSYKIADNFSIDGDFSGYLGSELMSNGNMMTNDFTDKTLSAEELCHRERMKVTLQDNSIVVIGPSSLKVSSINFSSQDGATQFVTDETGSSSSSTGKYPVDRIRTFKTSGLSKLRDTYNVDFTNSTYKVNDFVLQRAESVAAAEEALNSGVPAICYYDEEKKEFQGWINKDVLPSHLCSKESLLEPFSPKAENYNFSLIRTSFPEENFTAILARNTANYSINSGALGEIKELGNDYASYAYYAYKDENDYFYVHKTEANVTLAFGEPSDLSGTTKTQVVIKKNGNLEKVIDLMAEYNKVKDSLSESDDYFEFTDGDYSFRVYLSFFGSSNHSIDHIENLLVKTSLAGVNLLEVSTVLVNK